MIAMHWQDEESQLLESEEACRVNSEHGAKRTLAFCIILN